MTPYRSWAPPRATRKPVMTSSKISSAPFAAVSSRSDLEEPGLRGDDAHVGADRLHDDRGDPAGMGGEGRRDGLGVVVREDDRVAGGARGDARGARHGQRREAGAGVHEEAVAVAVVAAGELDDEVAAGRAAREADRAHHGLGARRHEAHPLHRRHRGADPLAQLDLAGPGGSEREPVERRLADRLDDRGVAVAQDRRAPRADVVEVPAAVGVADARPSPGVEDERRAADGAERPDRAVDAAREQVRGAGAQVGLAAVGGRAGRSRSSAGLPGPGREVRGGVRDHEARARAQDRGGGSR